MNCKHCQSNKVVSIYAKCNDLSWTRLHWLNKEYEGYLSSNLGGISDGNGLDIEICLECGTVQNFTPIDPKTLEAYYADEDE